MKRTTTTLTLLADLFFLLILLHYGLGGWANAVSLTLAFAPLSLLLLGLVLFLLLYHSDYRTDLPLFVAGLALGYWGEWWGTTRGVWTYWNGAMPPDYLPPLWGIGLLTVYRLSRLLLPRLPGTPSRPLRWGMAGSFIALPLLAFAWSWPRLATVDWRGRLDGHFVAGLLVAVALLLYRFDLRQDFAVYLCGLLLGGLYEYLGTSSGEWYYITREVPPLWIAPLWGWAAVAMCKLAGLLRRLLKSAWKAFSLNEVS